MLQAAQHMQAREVSMDSAMDGDAASSAAMAHPGIYQNNPDMGAHASMGDSFIGNASFTDGDSQMIDREDNNEEGDSVAGATKGGASRTSANNELEMRQLFRANQSRTLQDVAVELHGNERGPNSERTRQVFAMLW